LNAETTIQGSLYNGFLDEKVNTRAVKAVIIRIREIILKSSLVAMGSWKANETINEKLSIRISQVRTSIQTVAKRVIKVIVRIWKIIRIARGLKKIGAYELKTVIIS